MWYVAAMRTILLPTAALIALAAAAAPATPARSWRTYGLPGGGAVQLEVPAEWKEEVRQKDPTRAATIVLRGKTFEMLLTPIPARNGQPPAMADVEASLRKSGEKKLATAQQESIVLQPIEGEQVTGRYYRLTEKQTPPGEYPSVIAGGIVLGPVIASFTVLVHDLDGDEAREALRVIQSAKYQSGYVGVYHASLDDLRLNLVLAKAAGFSATTLVNEKRSFKAQLDDFVVEADAVEGDNLRIRVDGKDLDKARDLLAALTTGFARVR